MSVNAQSLVGKWKISHLITERTIDKYIIYKSEKERSYGNHLSINEDGTFSTYTREECGMSCFTTTLGIYKMIDENYIRFTIKSISKSGICEGESKPNKNIGLYYIHREENIIRLLKSNGNIEEDKQNVIYSKMITYFFNFQRMFPSGNKISSTKIEKMSEKDMVNTYLTNLGYTNFEYLFSKNIGYDDFPKIILTKIKGEYQYLNLHFSYPKDYYLSIFNYEPIRKIDENINKINSDKNLKAINIEEIPTHHSDIIFSLLTVFSKTEKNTVEKIIHQVFSKNFTITNIYYLENETPIYIEVDIINLKRNPVLPSQSAFYIIDWNANKYIFKNNNYGSRKFEKEKWEKIIELSKESIKN